MIRNFLKAFNEWRKRYWLLRTIIILLLFSEMIYQSLTGQFLMSKLVAIACQAIREGNEQSLVTMTCKFNKSREIKRLQTSLSGLLDLNKDGRIEDCEYPSFVTPTDIAELQKPAFRADFDTLANFAKMAGLAPKSYSTSEIRKNCLYAAIQKVESEAAPEWKKVDDMISLFYSNFPDPRVLSDPQIQMALEDYKPEIRIFSIVSIRSSYSKEKEPELASKPTLSDYFSYKSPARWKQRTYLFIGNLTDIIVVYGAPLLWLIPAYLLGLLFGLHCHIGKCAKLASMSLISCLFIYYFTSHVETLFRFYFLSSRAFMTISGFIILLCLMANLGVDHSKKLFNRMSAVIFCGSALILWPILLYYFQKETDWMRNIVFPIWLIIITILLAGGFLMLQIRQTKSVRHEKKKQ